MTEVDLNPPLSASHALLPCTTLQLTFFDDLRFCLECDLMISQTQLWGVERENLRSWQANFSAVIEDFDILRQMSMCNIFQIIYICILTQFIFTQFHKVDAISIIPILKIIFPRSHN